MQKVPERDSQLSAGLFQADKRVPTISAFIAARAATDLSFFHVVADVCFTAIGVQWDVRALQHFEKLDLVFVNTFE